MSIKPVTASSTRSDLTRRERQVMDIIYARGQATVADVQSELADNPSYSATRMLLQRLRKKDLLNYTTDGARYVYSAATPRAHAGEAAWQRLVKTFFGGSAANAFSALLGDNSDRLSDEELDELERLVASARERRR